MNDEIRLTSERLKRIQQAGQTLADTAAEVKDIADQLRADVDALSARIDLVEKDNVKVADNLVDAANVVEQQQVVQDGRLDNLEN